MHRSGTSALAGVLGHLGAALPQALATYALATIGESSPALAAPIAPDIAQALTETVRSNHVGLPLSGLLETEAGRRLSGASSLFADDRHWAAELSADLADTNARCQ